MIRRSPTSSPPPTWSWPLTAARTGSQTWTWSPDLVVGDLDSLDPDRARQLAAAGIPIERHPRDKDLIDGELAVAGGPGAPTRPNSPAGAFWAESAPTWSWPIRCCCSTPRSRPRRRPRWCRAGRSSRSGEDLLELAAPPGKTLSLVPVDANAAGVDIGGVRWPLADAALQRGQGRTLSNLVAADRVRVRLPERAGAALPGTLARSGRGRTLECQHSYK